MTAGMYGIDNSVDKRAVKAALAYNPLVSGRYEAESLGGLAEGDFEYARERGYLFRPNQVSLDHDAAVDRLLHAVKETEPSEQANLFLVSLSTHRLDYRVGLGALALAKNFPRHAFVARAVGPYCATCGLTRERNAVDRNFCNPTRFQVGAPVTVDPTGLAFYLECQQELQPMSPTPQDTAIFAKILEILCTIPPNETLKKLAPSRMKAIRGFKSSTEERKLLLQTLGYCGILETKEHGGMLHRYVNLGLAPRKTHSSDWRYPVDFWTGKDGLNKEALRFWFGSYPEFAEFM